MYSTCLFCNRDMGVNEVLETLPIGRRIAFDPNKGRLWVVCRGCERWNLVPFDTRLETIETCERLFRNTRTRFSTDNIGIARLAEGVELVRIGPAERPEFASWRYGDQFGRRRKRAAMYGVAGAAAVVGVYYLGTTVGISMGIMPSIYNGVVAAIQKRVIAARLPEINGVRGVVSRHHLKYTSLIRPGGISGPHENMWGVSIPLHRDLSAKFVRGDSPTINLWGDDAVRALGHLLPAVNAKGGKKDVVQSAVGLVEGNDMPALFEHARANNKPKKPFWGNTSISKPPGFQIPLSTISPTVRLALEMSSHEDAEREALAGDLKFLERQWREADKLAAIADSLSLPDDADLTLEQLKERKE